MPWDAAGIWARMETGECWGTNKCTPLLQAWPGGAEQGAAQPTPPALSWVLWLDTGVLRASPKFGQSTQPSQLGAVCSRSAHCLAMPAGGSNLAGAGQGPGERSPTRDGAGTGIISILCSPGDVTG